jgi:hypothetical protein
MASSRALLPDHRPSTKKIMKKVRKHRTVFKSSPYWLSEMKEAEVRLRGSDEILCKKAKSGVRHLRRILS